jgi:hypothetical protein
MPTDEAWWLTPAMLAWSQLLLESFRRCTDRDLLERIGTAEEQASALYLAPFVVVSHGTEGDPVLNYGNRIALMLWEADRAQFIRTPSRLTAEPANRAERERMLARAAAQGFIDDYRGVRITMSGRRFLVENALVWNVTQADGTRAGQAATFSHWTFL